MSWGPVRATSSPSGLTRVLTPQPGATPAQVDAALAEAFGSPARCVVVDLQHVRTVDWDVVDVWLGAHAGLEAAGRHLLLVNVLQDAARAIELMDTGGQLTVVTLERVLSPAWTEAEGLER